VGEEELGGGLWVEGSLVGVEGNAEVDKKELFSVYYLDLMLTVLMIAFL